MHFSQRARLRAVPKSLQQMRRTKSPAVTPGDRKYPFQVMQCLRLFGRKRGVCAQPNIATSGGAKSNLHRLPNTACRGARNKRGRSDLNDGPTKVSGLHGPTPIAPHPCGTVLSCRRKGRQFRRRSQERTRTSRHHSVERPQPLGKELRPLPIWGLNAGPVVGKSGD